MTRPMAMLIITAMVAACSGAAPTAPTPTPVPPPTPPALVVQVLTGTVAATNGGAHGAITVTVNGAPATMAGSTFRAESAILSSATVVIAGQDIITRSVRATFPGHANIEVFTTPAFDLTFYRHLARATLDGRAPLALQHWTQAPKVYIRTIDDRGATIPASVVDAVAATLINGTSAMTGGRFGLEGLERGTETREGQRGWLTVRWPLSTDQCGRVIGQDGGVIEINYRLDARCASAGVVAHELGHAMGFYHTPNPTDLMHSSFAFGRVLSERERRHMAYAYARPNGNLDPDTDP